MKPISNGKLMNKLITNNLIPDLFNYLSYSYHILQLCLLYHLVYISIIGSALVFEYLLALIFRFLTILIVLLATTFNFLLAIVLYLLSESISSLTALFNIRFFYLYQTISLNPLVTTKVCKIIWLVLDYIDSPTSIELARFYTILGKSAFKLQG